MSDAVSCRQENSADILFEEFNTIASAPGGVAKLRELILSLAVQGKLVPQNPADEPASVLLERIAAEKKRLVKKGEIKKAKPLPPVRGEEVPYAAPAGWELVRLGEVVDYNGRQKTEPKNIPKDAWLLELEDIEKDTSRIVQRLSAGERNPQSTKSAFKSEDVLYGKLRPYLNKVIVADSDGYCTTEIAPIRIYCDILPEYLKYALKRPEFLDYVNSKSYGMKMPRLGTNDAVHALLPLPPLPEQHRIVEKVDALMKLCDALEEQQAQQQEVRTKLGIAALAALSDAEDAAAFDTAWGRICDEFDLIFDTPENAVALRQTILQLAVQGKLISQNPEDEPVSALFKRITVEKSRLLKEGIIQKSKPLLPVADSEVPYAVPDGWVWVRLGNLGITQTGTTPSRNNSEFFGNDIPFIKPADIYESGINYGGEGLSKAGLKNGRLIPSGSVLMVCIGGSIGKTNMTKEDVSCNQQINAISPFELLNNKYVLYNLKSCYFQKQVVERAAVGSLPIINKSKWENIPLALPPLPEQHRIVTKVDALMALCDDLEAGIRKRREVQTSLLESVITGLTAQG